MRRALRYCLGAFVGACAIACDAAPVPDGFGRDAGPPGECRLEQRFAASVQAYRFGSGQDHNQENAFPDAVLGPPEPNTPEGVVSLGNGGSVTLAFGAAEIVDGRGADFIVFENPLPSFAELATVEVSRDGETWFAFPCTAHHDDATHGGCAGSRVVSEQASDPALAVDPERAGGDAFDLATLGLSAARFVRVTDRPDLDDALQGVFDLDAIALVHARCTETE